MPGSLSGTPAGARLVAGALLVFATSGCGSTITFRTHTIVMPNGAVTRTVRLSGDERQKLETAYALPPGGAWWNEAAADVSNDHYVSPPTWVYGTRHSFPPGAAIPPDHVRRAPASHHVATNAPHVSVRHYAVLSTFEYEDRLRDVATPETFLGTIQRAEQAMRHEAAAAIAAASSGSLTPEQAAAALAHASEAQLGELRVSMRRKGPRKTLEEKDWLDDWDDDLVDRVLRDLPAPPGTSADDWKDALENALDRAAARFELSPDDEEEFGGVFGFFHLFETYAFEVSATLPGTIVESNATRRDGERLVYPVRIAAAGATLAVLLALAVRRRRAGSAAESFAKQFKDDFLKNSKKL